MTAPRPADPADKAGADQFTPVHRNGGWTADQWLAWLARRPDACLPSGVGAMLVQQLRATPEELALLRRLERANDYEPGDTHGLVHVVLTPAESRRLAALIARLEVPDVAPPPP